ncbi:MAG: hypothetical protein ACO1QR_00255 [Chthoniobacteraceae bacterium]
MIFPLGRTIILFVVLSFVFPSLTSAETKRYGDARDWKWRQLGERKIHASLGTRGGRRTVDISVFALPTDNRPMRVSRLKVTATHKDGKSLEVAPYYKDGMMTFGRDFHVATFEVGTFVQDLRPDEVREVTVSGYGGKTVIKFLNGVAQEEESPAQ